MRQENATSTEIPRRPQVPRQPSDVRVQTPIVYVQPAWQYKHLIRRVPEETLPDDAELNGLGRDGWELVGVFAGPGSVHFYFKRLAK